MRHLAVLCVMLASLSGALAQMTHEETVVRNTYAKLSYAVDLETAYRAALTNPSITDANLAKVVMQQGLRFSLSGFTAGELSDVLDANFRIRFPQYDDGQEVVHTGVNTDTFSDGGATVSMETLTVKWGPGPTLTGAGELSEYTVKQMIPILQNELGVSPLVRYCSFNVTASLAGRSRTYQATFFFGKNGQAAPLDPVVGGDGNNLEHFFLHPVFPSLLLQTITVGANPVVRNFLTANQKNGPSCKSGDACCDAETLQCGVFSADLEGRQPWDKRSGALS
jgi:hypothetical protein